MAQEEKKSTGFEQENKDYRLKTTDWLQVVILPDEYCKTLTDCVLSPIHSHTFHLVPVHQINSNHLFIFAQDLCCKSSM